MEVPRLTCYTSLKTIGKEFDTSMPVYVSHIMYSPLKQKSHSTRLLYINVW